MSFDLSFETITVPIPPCRVNFGIQLQRHNNGVLVTNSKYFCCLPRNLRNSQLPTPKQAKQSIVIGEDWIELNCTGPHHCIAGSCGAYHPNIQQYDVLVSLNGTTLYNVEGGLDGIKKLFKRHENSEMTVVVHRASRDEESYYNKCCFVDQVKQLRCKNKACRKGGGPCEKHYFGKCLQRIGIGTCPNNAIDKAGMCGQHGDTHRCKQRSGRGKLRCINPAKTGCNGYCGICYPSYSSEQSTGGTCHPPSILLDIMDKIKYDVTPHMSELQLKTMTLLHKIRTKMTHDRFQPNPFSVNESLSELVVELMKEHLTDEKYKDKWVRGTDGSYQPLDEYVHFTILTSLKGALRDFGGDGIDYKGVLSEKLVREIIDKIVHFVKDEGLWFGNVDDGLSLVKVGSEGTIDGSELVASKRARDEITYPREAFVRDKWTPLHFKLSPKQRGCAERIGALLLLGLGIGANILLPGHSVPSGTDSSTSDLYLMVSTGTSLFRHHAARGTAPAKSPSAPPGHKIVLDSNNIETVVAAPTAATAAGGGGVDDDSVSTTAANTSVSAGENTNIIQFCGDRAVQPSEVATATPTDKSSPEMAHGSGNLKPAAQPISGCRSESPNNVTEFPTTLQSGQSSKILHSFENDADDWNVIHENDSMSGKRKNSSNELTHANLEALQAITAKNRAQEGMINAQRRRDIKNELRDEQRNEKKAKKAVVDAYNGNEDMANKKIEQYENFKDGSEEVMQFSQDDLLNEHYDVCCEVCYLGAELKKLSNTN